MSPSVPATTVPNARPERRRRHIARQMVDVEDEAVRALVALDIERRSIG
jgi:hypothetical protein